jgi:inhibitor of KinA
MHPSYHLYPCGDHAVTIELGDRIDVSVNDRVIALFQYLQSLQVNGIRDIIPSYHTITLVYDPALLYDKAGDSTVYEYVCEWLHDIVKKQLQAHIRQRKMRIPVCYDPAVAWDISYVAEQHGITIEEVIQLHTSVTYRVYLVGFLPGFAYMGTVDARIATPRKASPRAMVPEGSVGIAGEQTGIYPFASPGGWQIIGQTPVQMFHAHAEQPCYLQPGDEVNFYRVDLITFHEMKLHEH